jgi:hypothetical protein
MNALVQLFVGGEPVDKWCYDFLSLPEHAVQSSAAVIVSALALWTLRPRISLPPFRSSRLDSVVALLFIAIELAIIAQRSYQNTLITLANLCHITTFGCIYCLLSNTVAARWVYVLFCLPHAMSPLPALLFPDRNGWNLPFYGELFFFMHGSLLVLPWYMISTRAAPLVKFMTSMGFRTFLRWIACGTAFAFILWFGVLAPLALASTSNLFYMLCAPGNLRTALAFLGKGWSLIGHVALAVIGAVYSSLLCYVVAPLVVINSGRP